MTPPFRPKLRRASMVLLAGLLAGEAAAAPINPSARQTVRATAADLFNIADEMVRRGSVDSAEPILSMLARDPNPHVRNEARFRHAKLLKSKGSSSRAAILLRAILDENPGAGPVRIELAHALQALGDTEGALRELRAAQSAGLPPAVARMIDRYSEALRASRQMGASFEIALAPDSNINRATSSDRLGTIFGDFDIGQESKSTSGLGASVRGQAYRRFSLGSSDHNLLVRASGFADLYGKTQFNDIAADLALGPELRFGRNRVNFELGFTHRWFGQEPFVRSGRIGATWTRPLGSRTQVRLNGVAALIDNSLNDLQDGRSYSGHVAVERALSPSTGIALNFAIDRQSLKDPGYSTTGWQAGLFGWRDVGRTTVTLGAEIGRRKADERLLLFPQKRSDRYSRFTAGATMRQFTFQGFAPVARFTIERNHSTLEFHDYKRTRTEFAVVRAF